MSDWKKYLNDPDIANEPMVLREIHAIRLKIHNDTKHMPPAERAKHANAEAHNFIEKYDLKVRLPENIQENNPENDRHPIKKAVKKRPPPTKSGKQPSRQSKRKTPTHA